MASAETFDDPPSMSAKRVLALFLWVVMLVLWCRPAVAAPSGFTYCAGELGYCELSGVDAYIVFGAGEGACDLTAGTCTGSFSTPVRYPSGFSGTCSAEVLIVGTDPAPGVAKACYWIASGGGTVEPPSGGASAPAFNPFNMPAEDGLVISAFIITVWGAAYAWKMAKRALDTADE